MCIRDSAKPLQQQQYKLFITLLWYCCTCNALRAAIAGLSCCLQFRFIPHGSYCVLHATSFITSFVPLHYTSFVAKPFASCWASQAMHIPSHRECTSLSQANPTILTGFHSASLRHSFTSVAFSPPAAHNLARLAATVCVTGLHWH